MKQLIITYRIADPLMNLTAARHTLFTFTRGMGARIIAVLY